MEKKLHDNIWKYTVLLITNKRIFAAIIGAYYLTIPDVTPKTIGLILLIGNFSGFLLEIPSGYLSDKVGHKQTLVAARVLSLLSTLFFLTANNIPLLILGSVFLSASAAFNSGTGSAFMHETLRGLNKEHDYAKIMGRASSVGFAVPIIFMVLVPFLVSFSYKMPFALGLIIDLIGLFVSTSLVVPPVTPEDVKEVRSTNFKQVMHEGYHLNFFSLALFSGVMSGVLFAISGFRGPYQIFLAVPVIWFGVFFGVGRALASLLLAYSGKIKNRINLLSFYRFQLIVYPLLAYLLGLTSIWWVAVLIFILFNAFQWGLSKIDEGYQLDLIRSSKFKATLLSTTSQIDSIFAGAVGFGFGLVIERLSYQRGFLYLGIAYFIVIFPLYLYIARQYKKGAYKS